MSRLGRRMVALAFALGACASGGAFAQEAVAVVTIVDGDAQLIHGTQKLALAEGVRVAAGDIVQTGAAARIVRLEFNGAAERIVNLGPATQVMLAPRFSGAGAAARPATLYLAQGWVKTSEPLASATLDLSGVTGKAVLRLAADGAAQAFSESGTTALVDRAASGKALTLKSGEFFQRAAGASGQMLPRPAPDFLAQVPRPFVDTLPARIGLFKDHAVTPKPLGTVSYDDLQPWLDAEPALRRSYLSRWMPLTRDPAFRKPLVEHLAAHREWEPILFPERFNNKPHAAH